MTKLSLSESFFASKARGEISNTGVPGQDGLLISRDALADPRDDL